MKKFINNVDTFLNESLNGFLKANSEIVSVNFNPDYIFRKNKPQNSKVSLISGGGSGHEPLHGGYVGYGMLDAACPGQVFSAPTPDQISGACQEVHNKKGILFIVKNYSGDIMNFEMASELLDFENQMIIVNDDVAVEDSTYTSGRRGVAGTLIVEKIVGSFAETGASLSECKEFGEDVIRSTRSLGVALTSCVVPAAGKPTFDISFDEMEFGVGIHGEPGRERQKIKSASEITKDLIYPIIEDLKLNSNDDVLLHINGFGGTPLMELYLLFHTASNELTKNNIKISRSLVGNYTTSLDMVGASITLTKMKPEFTYHWDAPVSTSGLRWGL